MAVPGSNPLGGGLDARRVVDIDRHRLDVESLPSKLPGGVLALRRIARTDDRGRAGLGELAGCLEAEASVRTGDQSDLLHRLHPLVGSTRSV